MNFGSYWISLRYFSRGNWLANDDIGVAPFVTFPPQLPGYTHSPA
jgi:hypothetical protein